MTALRSSPSAPDFATVRRIEAVSFRSFPSNTTYYDGTWAIRLTAGHPARRLNSVTPLDPSDNTGLEHRLELARRRFHGFGRPLVFRMSPLAPTELHDLLDREGWSREDETLVMAAPLDATALACAVDQVPLKDTGRWVDAWLALNNLEAARKPGMVEVLQAIKAETGLFLTETQAGDPQGAVRCVRDADLAGIFELVCAASLRGQGHGRSILTSALKWAMSRGASAAWLQVGAGNDAAIGLYRSMGFAELYRYDYRCDPA